MDAGEVAQLARDMAAARQLGTLTGVFLAALVQDAGCRHAFCYRLDVAGDRLMPLVGATGPLSDWPSIDMGEMQNPLVYCLIDGRPCQVDRVGRLVAVGQGFDLLREHLGADEALLAVPLRHAQGHALAVCVLVGAVVALDTWRGDTVWQTLTELHQHLFGRAIEQNEVAEQVRYERAVRRRSEVEQGQTRAARLLAAEFVGVSAAAARVREEMLRLADSSLSTLITGETGTGKDHAAWLIHQASSRTGPFVPVNCAAISAELIEAELFGSVKGAFTGATQSRNGLVAEAHGGTLFLDEIGDMPLSLQASLLRVLNEKKYRPVGSTREHESDFRLICATHQPLPQRIREGRFREDLYFRIRQMTLHLPALRERSEDIPALAMHALQRYNRERHTHVVLESQALTWLQAQSLPGNVRELRNLVFAAAEWVGSNARIGVNDVRPLKASFESAADDHLSSGELEALLVTDALPKALDAFERLLIRRHLVQAKGSRARAARSLGIPTRTLAYKCRKLNVDEEMDVS